MPITFLRPGSLSQAVAAILWIVAAGSAAAAEVESVEVERNGGVFSVEMRTRLDVSAEAAFGAYTDYPRLPEINPAVQSVRLLSAPEAACPPAHGRGKRETTSGNESVFEDIGTTRPTRIDVRLKVCVAFYCPRFRMTQDMRPGREGESYLVAASLVRELSDYRRGDGLWRFSPCEGGSCLHFSATLEPDFWVPPLLGTWLIRRELRRQAMATSEGIEAVARARETAGSSGEPHSEPAQACDATLGAS